MAQRKVKYDFNPFTLVGEKPSTRRGQRKALEIIEDFVLEQVLDHVGDARSPVGKGAWKASLSKEYRAIKSQVSGSTVANMELTGDMLDNLDVDNLKGNTLRLGFTSKTENDKADGHNNFSGKSTLPRREFVPKEGQTFKRTILKGIKDIIEDVKDEEDA